MSVTAYQAFAVGRAVLAVLLTGFFVALAVGRLPAKRVRPLVFGILTASLLGYLNFGFLHLYRDGHAIHYWDAFHYFMGAKYLPELGYSRLYEATFIAGREMGNFRDVTAIRDLTTYELRDVRSIDGAAVHRRFSPERWLAFKRDLLFFGAHIDEWPRPMFDHGYNDPPARAFLLHGIVRWLPATMATLVVLTSLDYILMAVALAAVWRAFGAIPAALAFASLWLSFFARFDFIGGSILRSDWIAAVMLAMSALARGAGRTAGLFLAYAALARIFPVLLLLPLTVKWVQARAQKSPDATLSRCVAVAAGVILAVTGAVWVGQSVSFAEEYLARIRLHSQVLQENSVGLGPLIAFNSATWSMSPDGGVYLAQAAALASQPATWILPLVCALYLLAVVPLMLRTRPLASVVYAVPLIFFALSLSGYYYSFLMLLVLLPWDNGRVAVVSLLQMALLMGVMAAAFAFQVISTDSLPVSNAVGIQMAVFFVLWLAFEYSRLGSAGVRSVAVTPRPPLSRVHSPADGPTF
jgi:hypothetical protein